MAGDLQFQRLLVDHAENGSELRSKLKKFVKKHPSYVPAVTELAERESNEGNVEDAAQYFVQAARESGRRHFWYEAAKLWMQNNLGDRALSAARSAVRNTTGVGRLRAELDLIRLLLAFEHIDEAKRLLEQFLSLAKTESVTPDIDLMRDFLILKGYCLNLRREFDQATQVWKNLSDHEFEFQAALPEPNKRLAIGAPPSPTLSTP